MREAANGYEAIHKESLRRTGTLDSNRSTFWRASCALPILLVWLTSIGYAQHLYVANVGTQKLAFGSSMTSTASARPGACSPIPWRTTLCDRSAAESGDFVDA